MGHYSAGFTLDTYGRLMEALPQRQVEWIDELVFPESWEAALKIHSDGAAEEESGCSRPKGWNPWKIRTRETSCSPVQPGAWWAREDLNLGLHLGDRPHLELSSGRRGTAPRTEVVDA